MSDTHTPEERRAHDPERITSSASVRTERAARYGRQLAAHMGRKVPFTWDPPTGTGAVTFVAGQVTARLRAEPDALVLELDATTATIDRYEAVLGGHLVRFGAREALVCAWRRSDGTAGSAQAAPSEPV